MDGDEWDVPVLQSQQRTSTLVRQQIGGFPCTAFVRDPPWSSQVCWSLWSNHPLAVARSPVRLGQDDQLPTISALHMWSFEWQQGVTVHLNLNPRFQKLCNMMLVNWTQLAPVYEPGQSDVSEFSFLSTVCCCLGF